MYTILILGPPRTKKNHGRLVRNARTGRQRMIPSAAFIAYQDSALAQIAMRGKPPMLARPLNCAAIFYRDAERGDAVGYYQALADILQKAGVVADDKFIVSWDGSRLSKSKRSPRVEIVLTEAE